MHHGVVNGEMNVGSDTNIFNVLKTPIEWVVVEEVDHHVVEEAMDHGMEDENVIDPLHDTMSTATPQQVIYPQTIRLIVNLHHHGHRDVG